MDSFFYLWHTAEVWVRHQLLPHQLLKGLFELAAVLEISEEGGGVVEAPEAGLVASGVLLPNGLGLMSLDDLQHDSDTLGTQHLRGKEGKIGKMDLNCLPDRFLGFIK